MSTLGDIIQAGLLADQPTAGTAGRLYFATDTGQTFRDNGATWDDVSDAGTGALVAANNLSDLPSAATARTNLGLGTAATKNTGTTAGTVAAGDDSRITGALQATSNLSDVANAGTARGNLGLGTAAVANTGTGSSNVILGNDSRLTDARTPTSHHTSHNTGGTDAIAPADIGAAAASHTHTASAVTDFSEAVDDRVAALLVAGTNVTLTYNDGANTLTIDATGGGGGGSALTVDEVDGTPSDAATTRITFPNGSLTDSSGHVTYAPPLATTSVQGEVVLATPSSDTTAGHVVQANDTRLSDSRTPSGSAGGDLSGTYPNPAVALITAGYVDMTEISAPSNPASGKLRLYASTGHALHTLTNSGTDTTLGAGGGGGNTTYTNAYASPPGSPTDGDVWLPSDTPGDLRWVRISGAWVPYFRGQQTAAVPNAASWSWYNQNSSSLADKNGALLFTSGGSSGTNSSLIYKALAATTNYTLTVPMLPQPPLAGTADWGLAVRDSSSGKYQSVSWQNGTLYVFNWTSNSSVAVQASVTIGTGNSHTAPDWFQIQDDGTNRIFRAGWNNGGRWVQVTSITRTTFCTPDQWGVALDNQGGASPYAALMIYGAKEA